MKSAAGILRGAVVFSTLAVLAAVAVPAVILASVGQASSVAVVFAKPIDPRRLPDHVAISGWNGSVVRLDGVGALQARALYAMGAILVLPMRSGNCLGLRRRALKSRTGRGCRPAFH